MQTTLKATKETLLPDDSKVRIFDLTGRCAFAVCVHGDMDVSIMHRVHRVGSHDMVLCMPFVHIEVTKVREPSEVIIGGIDLDDVLSIINRTVASNNLLAIRLNPVVRLDSSQFEYIKTSVEEYWRETADSEGGQRDNISHSIHREVIGARSQLIVAQVLKLYFTNMPMDVKAHSHHDMVFQHFMLDLYANFRQERNVGFYARRSGLSLKYFSTLVRELSGASPSEWVETVVVGEAKMMLYNPHRSIKEIASALSFPDGPTFTKYFSRVTGRTPRAYRQSIDRSVN